MKLATVRNSDSTTTAVRVEEDSYVGLEFADVGELLAEADWESLAGRGGGTVYPLAGTELAPLVTRPHKIVCVGLNYRSHILEMGRDLPEYPTLFSKFSDSLIGAHDNIDLAPESESVDWEAELTIVIGRTVRRADARKAAEAIAGFTIMNDVTMRDWQWRTKQWLQGKTFDRTTPLGPVLVTPDELEGGVAPTLTLASSVDGEPMQSASTSDLLFGPVDLIKYISTITTLHPGDVIATGTPGGVGHAQTPPRYLVDGSTLVTEISGIGRMENVARRS